jgi:hypothetical protein
MTTASRRSRALHRAVAARLRAEPALLERARARVDEWLDSGSVHREYALAWRELLAGDVEALAVRLDEDSDRMNDLRQVSPFAGALDARTRWAVLREERP